MDIVRALILPPFPTAITVRKRYDPAGAGSVRVKFIPAGE
jgi:hypothetical protein